MVTGPFRQAYETRRERNGRSLAPPTHIRQHPIRSDRGSDRQRSRPPNAPCLSWCRGGALRVNTVSPGSILVPGNGWDRYRLANQEYFDDYVRHGFPMGRLGTAEEVADVIAFLASPRAHWINGRNIPVDGLEQPHAPLDRRPF
jgi:hypothetical protein